LERHLTKAIQQQGKNIFSSPTYKGIELLPASEEEGKDE
jgi:hypothetical protein